MLTFQAKTYYPYGHSPNHFSKTTKTIPPNFFYTIPSFPISPHSLKPKQKKKARKRVQKSRVPVRPMASRLMSGGLSASRLYEFSSVGELLSSLLGVLCCDRLLVAPQPSSDCSGPSTPKLCDGRRPGIEFGVCNGQPRSSVRNKKKTIRAPSAGIRSIAVLFLVVL